ncbi:MAG: DUF4274 domain-containing protein, partial [Planctomycetota bacterium]
MLLIPEGALTDGARKLAFYRPLSHQIPYSNFATRLSPTLSSKRNVHLLSADERKRVIDALHFDPDAGNVVSLVESLQTSAEIHQFVLSYNCNDGLLPLRAIAKTTVCDLGTALCIYWLLGDFVMDRESYRDDTDPDWDGVGLIEEIENRV